MSKVFKILFTFLVGLVSMGMCLSIIGGFIYSLSVANLDTSAGSTFTKVFGTVGLVVISFFLVYQIYKMGEIILANNRDEK